MPRNSKQGRGKQSNGRIRYRKVYPSHKKETPGTEPPNPAHACGMPQQCVMSANECALFHSESYWADKPG